MGRRQCGWFDMFSHISLVAYIHILLTLSSFKLSFAFSPSWVSYCKDTSSSTFYIKYPMLRAGNRLIHQYRSSTAMSISAQNIDTPHPQEVLNNQHRPGVPTTPKHKKKEPADYDEAVGNLSAKTSDMKLDDDDDMDVEKEGGIGVTTGQSQPPPNNNTTTTQGTTNTSTTENNRQGQGSGVAMEEDVVEDKDVKMKDKETASRILETPKKKANSNNDDDGEDDTKQAAVDFAVPTIKIKELYDTNSLEQCLAKCEHEKCKLSAVIRAEVNEEERILCIDHLER